ncbi:MAG: flavodoxin family protein [Desulfuromonadaceae bacterium]|nr:flavodoxin family protein [Desulfuromonadaceae bacterium]
MPHAVSLKLAAIYGSPRRLGNTSRLLKQAVAGAGGAGATVEEVFLRDLNISPCMEEDGCHGTGRCLIDDDFQKVYDLLEECDGVLLASPLFFGSVSAQAKILIDRCQCFWVRKYLLGKGRSGLTERPRLGLFVSAAARRERGDLFDGAVRTVRYFFDALDVTLWKTLLCPGLEKDDDVLARDDFLQEAHGVGVLLVEELQKSLAGRR